MKRVIVICEGQTEQSFCNDILYPHFIQKGIIIRNTLIKKTSGGIVAWGRLKNEIETHLKQDKTALVTTLIDYYGIKESHLYPQWTEAEKIVDRNIRIQHLENAMLQDIHPDLSQRFIPYIQLHEFEALLFSDIDVFERNFEKNEFADFDYLKSTIQEFSNPEMINNGKETAPSKRLLRVFKKYEKITLGSLLANEIGLKTIREKCPCFNNWLNSIEEK